MSASGFVVIGAGPTGLGAAHRLAELGAAAFVVLEAGPAVGGLARSVTDEAGCTWDIGGHVLFSHYPYYDRLVDDLLGDDYRCIRREAWIWMEERFIPYPFQHNIRGLRPETVEECLSGLRRARAAPFGDDGPGDFGRWVEGAFGAGMARHFMLPYNWKVWATPPERMACSWIAGRVAPVDVGTVVRHVTLGEDQPAWGPNATFRYPCRGGTGWLFERLAERIAPHVRLDCPVVAVDSRRRCVEVANGRRFAYDALLSTMPLNELIGALSATGPVPVAVRRATAQLEWTSTHIVGVALDRPTDTTRTWVYYPELDVPFHRLTYLSNYSPHMAARPGQTLLLTETSASAYKPEDPATIARRVVSGLRRIGVLRSGEEPASVWHHTATRSYPVPTLRRDAALAVIESWLAGLGIASRGRFGAWRYEIGNMDHSCMQGVEWADHVVTGSEETVWTPLCA